MPEAMKRPNLLIIMSDGQGPWALGCAGILELKTPNIDRLAAGGIRFENFFCVSPVCSPARAMDFLETHAQENSDTPFCLSLHYTAPHAPWRESEQSPDIWNAYADTEFSLPREEVNPIFGASPWNPAEDERRETILRVLHHDYLHGPMHRSSYG